MTPAEVRKRQSWAWADVGVSGRPRSPGRLRRAQPAAFGARRGARNNPENSMLCRQVPVSRVRNPRLRRRGMGEVCTARSTARSAAKSPSRSSEAVAQHPEAGPLEREARLLPPSPPEHRGHPWLERARRLLPGNGAREGETLGERSARGAIPIEETLRIFKQIAEGLEAAHGQAIIHRDLKPANIMITPQGTVKILDFGLAKVVSSEDSAFASKSPTLSSAPTMAGMVMGTAAYMSPEQARGEPVDRRTDIWAFGCLLYECVTGRRAFAGRSNVDTIAAVLGGSRLSRTAAVGAAEAAAPDPAMPAEERHVRLHDIADARIEIDDVARDRWHPPWRPSRSIARAVSWRHRARCWRSRRRQWRSSGSARLRV